jgi:hypothetical protein
MCHCRSALVVRPSMGGVRPARCHLLNMTVLTPLFAVCDAVDVSWRVLQDQRGTCATGKVAAGSVECKRLCTNAQPCACCVVKRISRLISAQWLHAVAVVMKCEQRPPRNRLVPHAHILHVLIILYGHGARASDVVRRLAGGGHNARSLQTHTYLGKLLERLAVELETAQGRVETSVPIRSHDSNTGLCAVRQHGRFVSPTHRGWLAPSPRSCLEGAPSMPFRLRARPPSSEM